MDYTPVVIFISVTVCTTIEPVFVATITVEGVADTVLAVSTTSILRIGHTLGAVFRATTTPNGMVVGT
jgi:hypothetical protein